MNIKAENVHRYRLVKALSQAGNKLEYKPHGPDVVMADQFDEMTSERDLRTRQRNRLDELLNDIINASGVAKPTDVSDKLHGPDLIATGIDAMWLIEKQRQTLDDARKVIEMFMPNVASCFGIDVGALNRTMMNIALVQRGVKQETGQ